MSWLRAKSGANNRPDTESRQQRSRWRGYARARSRIQGTSSGGGCPQLLMGHGFFFDVKNERAVVTREARVRTQAHPSTRPSRSVERAANAERTTVKNM